MSKFEGSSFNNSTSTTSTTSTIQINSSNNNNNSNNNDKPIESTTEELSIYLKNAVQHGMVNLVKKLLINAKLSDLTLELLYLCGPNGIFF
jgi:hypothetical protein